MSKGKFNFENYFDIFLPGHFKPTMLLEVIGQVGETNNPHSYHSEVIFSLPIKLTGFSNVVRQVPKPRFNTGLSNLLLVQDKETFTN